MAEEGEYDAADGKEQIIDVDEGASEVMEKGAENVVEDKLIEGKEEEHAEEWSFKEKYHLQASVQ